MTVAVPYIWIAGKADSLALWPIGEPVSSAPAAERVVTTAGYDLDGEIDTVEQGGRWCVFVMPCSALRVLGETVYGADHVAPLARAAGVQTRTMRRWLFGIAEPADWTDVFRRLRPAIEPDVRDLIDRARRAQEMFAPEVPA